MAFKSLAVKYTADTSEAIAGLQRVNKAIDDSTKRIENSFGSLHDKLKNVGVGMTLALTVPLTMLGKASIDAYVQMDSLKRGLTAVTGSAAAMNAEFAKLKEVAKLPGLGLREAIQGATQLQAAGMNADLAVRSLSAFGNALATVGKGKAELEGVNLALTQIISKGKISAEEINQIAERVPQIRKVMKDAFGTADTEQLQKMGIAPEQFIAKIVESLEKLPKVTSGAQNAFENLDDALFQFKSSLGEQLAPSVIKIVEVFTDWLDKLKDTPQWVKTTGIVLGGLIGVSGPLVIMTIELGTAILAWKQLRTEMLATAGVAPGVGSAVAGAGGAAGAGGLLGKLGGRLGVGAGIAGKAIASPVGIVAGVSGLALAGIMYVENKIASRADDENVRTSKPNIKRMEDIVNGIRKRRKKEAEEKPLKDMLRTQNKAAEESAYSDYSKMIETSQTQSEEMKQLISAKYEYWGEVKKLNEAYNKGEQVVNQMALAGYKYQMAEKEYRDAMQKKALADGWEARILSEHLNEKSQLEINAIRKESEYMAAVVEASQQRQLNMLEAQSAYEQSAKTQNDILRLNIAQKKAQEEYDYTVQSAAEKEYESKYRNYLTEKYASWEAEKIALGNASESAKALFNAEIDYYTELDNLREAYNRGEQVTNRYILAYNKYIDASDKAMDLQKKEEENKRAKALEFQFDKAILNAQLADKAGSEIEILKANKDYALSDGGELAGLRYSLAQKQIADEYKKKQDETNRSLATQIQDRIKMWNDEARERVRAWNYGLQEMMRSETGFTSILGLNERTAKAGLATRYDNMLLPEPEDKPLTAQDVDDAIAALQAEQQATNDNLQTIIDLFRSAGYGMGGAYAQ